MYFKIMACLACTLLFAQPAAAFEKIFAKYCKNSKAPLELALAVAKQESGMKPLCINVQGRDHFPATHAEAEAIIRKAVAENKSFDVGLMQINSQWLKRFNVDPVDLLEPETNIRIGVQLLHEEIERHGLNWRAVGGYHSPNPLRGHYYAGMVSRKIKGNPELKSKLSNPRMGMSLFDRRYRLAQIRALSQISRGDIGQSHAQRAPVEWLRMPQDPAAMRRFARNHRRR